MSNVDKKIEQVIKAALNNGKELTYQQAMSIVIRCDEIFKENDTLAKQLEKIKRKEIRECWKKKK